MVIKLDFEKAFDKLNWGFMDFCLYSMGFNNIWRSWIQNCLESHVSVLVNGSPTHEFKLSSGVKQGCPLSPFLFILAAEALHLLLERCSSQGLFSGIDLNNNCRVSHLQFADDMIIFAEASVEAASNIKSILQGFGLASGLKVNFDKSRVIYFGTRHNLGNDIAAALGCSSGSLPIIYLGFPLGSNPGRSATWKPIIDKFRNRLSLWRGKHLSFGGRLTLLKAALSSLPLFFMSLFKAPKKVIATMERLQRRFFWGNRTGHRPFCKVRWATVCLPKHLGGLGVRSISTMNTALLAKWWWRFATSRDSLWKTVICSKYGWDTREWDLSVVTHSRLSKVFKDITDLNSNPSFAPLFGVSGLLWKLGRGDQIKFWTDIWSGNYSLRDSYPRLYSIAANKSGSVAEHYSMGWVIEFRRDLFEREIPSFEHLSQHIETLRPTPHKQDSLFWAHNPKGLFTVKLATSALLQHSSEPAILVAWSKYIWKAISPPKIQVFLWLAALDRLPTACFLEERGVNISIAQCLCRRCSSFFEDGTHILLRCSFALNVWSLVFQWWGGAAVVFLESVSELVVQWVSLLSSKHSKIWNCVCHTTLWHLWTSRNRLIFDDINEEAPAILGKIQHMSYMICTAKFIKSLDLDVWSFSSWVSDPFCLFNLL